MRGPAAIVLTVAALALGACDNRQNTSYQPSGGRGGGTTADPVMQRMAQEALPAARGLERCRATYGSYPPTPEATIGCIAGGAQRQGQFVRVGAWIIMPDASGAGYTMTRQIDAKAMLLRKCIGQSCRWIYDPGDGRPSLEMNLGA